MFPKDFRFTLEAYGDKLVLELPPEGWKEYGNQWFLDKDVFGYSRRASVPMRFVKEGADFLRRIASNYGMNGECKFTVERLDRNTLTYFVDYVGGVDFSKTSNNRLFFEAPIIDKGIPQMLNAYGGTKYEIDIDSSRAVNISTAEGMTFIEFAKYFIFEGNTIRFYRVPVYEYQGNQYDYNNLCFNMMIDDDNVSIKSPEFAFQKRTDWDHVANPSNPNAGPDKQHFLEKVDTISGDHIITCNVDISIGYETKPSYIEKIDSAELSFEIVELVNGVVKQRAESQKTIIEKQEFSDRFKKTIRASVQLQMTNEKSKYELRYKTKLNGAIDTGSQYSDFFNLNTSGEVSFEYNGTYQTPVFSFKALPIIDFVNEVTKKCCKIENDIVTHLLEHNINEKYFITSADAIRGIEGAKGVISWKDMFDSLDAMFFIGMQTKDQQIQIVPKNWIWEKNTLLLDVGEVKDLEFSTPQAEWIFNKFKIGYENQTYEEQNGREEFNIGLEFESPIISLNSKRDIISKIRADSFGIQDIRWKFGQNKTKDSSSDNDLFIVCAQKFQGKYTVDNTPTIQPMRRRGAFNAQLTPKRCMMKWYPYLASIYDKMINDYVRYVSSDKVDANVTTSMLLNNGNPDVIVEKEDVRVGNMGEKLFTPIIAEFKTGLRKNVTQLMAGDPRGYIEFKYNGVVMQGFPFEIPQDSIKRGQQQWRVMMHPETPPDIEEMFSKK